MTNEMMPDKDEPRAGEVTDQPNNERAAENSIQHLFDKSLIRVAELMEGTAENSLDMAILQLATSFKLSKMGVSEESKKPLPDIRKQLFGRMNDVANELLDKGGIDNINRANSYYQKVALWLMGMYDSETSSFPQPLGQDNDKLEERLMAAYKDLGINGYGK